MMTSASDLFFSHASAGSGGVAIDSQVTHALPALP